MNFLEAERAAASTAVEVERLIRTAGFDATVQGGMFRVTDTEFTIGVGAAFIVDGETYLHGVRAKLPVGERFAAQAADRLLLWLCLKLHGAAPLTPS